jgi:hypothetical protein
MAKKDDKFTDEWGRVVARQRYDNTRNLATMDQTSEEAPQDACDKRREPAYTNVVPSNWLRGMGKGEAEGKPGFDHVGKNPKGK